MAVHHIELDADASEFATRLHFQLAQTVGIEIAGMRVQPRHHALDCGLHKLLIIVRSTYRLRTSSNTLPNSCNRP